MNSSFRNVWHNNVTQRLYGNRDNLVNFGSWIEILSLCLGWFIHILEKFHRASWFPSTAPAWHRWRSVFAASLSLLAGTCSGGIRSAAPSLSRGARRELEVIRLFDRITSDREMEPPQALSIGSEQWDFVWTWARPGNVNNCHCKSLLQVSHGMWGKKRCLSTCRCWIRRDHWRFLGWRTRFSIGGGTES